MVRRRLASFLLFGTILSFRWDVFAAPFVSAYDRVMASVLMHDEQWLQEMISSGLNVNSLNALGQTPLCAVIRNQDVRGYKMLLANGASIHVPCMRQIPSQELSSFYENNPELGQYYNGQVFVVNKKEEEKEKGVAFWDGIPWPHVGEFVLGGVAVGLVAAIGSGGKEQAPQTPEEVISPFKPVETGLTGDDFPVLGNYFTEKKQFPTSDALERYLANYKNKTWDNDNVTDIAREYNGWYKWRGLKTKKDGTTEYYPVNVVPFLPMINAGSAYVRGYTGKIVDRETDPNNPTVSDKKVKVSVFDTGLEVDDYAHDQLKNNISATRLNFAYGPCSEKNNKTCWEYNEGKQQAVLKGTTVSVSLEKEEWAKYSMPYAPICSGSSYKCLNLVNEDDSHPSGCAEGKCQISYQYDDSTSVTVTVSPQVWKEYKEKYAEDGYIYDPNDPTPAILYSEINDSKADPNHGTAVAGIIAALQDEYGMAGVAPDAEIIPVRADFFMGTSVLQNLKDVVQTDAQIINLSLGTEQLISADKTKNDALWEQMQNLGFQEAAQKNTVLVFAAGNEGKSQPHSLTVAPLIGDSEDIKENYANSVYKNLLISVVAVDENKQIASYSNRCGASSMYCLSAPGGTEDVPMGSTVIADSFGGVSGTSMAAPVVSGSVAVLMGAFPFLKPQEVVQILFETAQYLEPTQDQIDDYNSLAIADGTSYTYADLTKDGEYNAIYGHGLVDLDAATDPIGLEKISFDTVASSTKAVPIASTSITVPDNLAHTLSVLPESIVVLDKYTRPYDFATSRLVKKQNSSDALKRSFQSFMASDENKVQSSDALAFGFTSAPSDSVGLPVGSLSMDLAPTSDLKIRMGYAQDTKSFGDSYTKRMIQNPFMNMRQAWGTDVSWNMAGNWFLTGGFQYGQNGFIDSEVLENMEDKPMVNTFQTGLRYAPKKSVVFNMNFGQTDEEKTLMGMYGDGAFNTDGTKTRFISFETTFIPFEHFNVSASYTYGVTDANDSNSLMKFSRMKSDAFAMTLSYTPNDDSLYGFKVSSPLRVRSGQVTFDLPTGRDMYADRLYRTQYTADMKSDKREYDLSLFFMNQYKDNVFFAGEMGVRLNPEHQEQAEPDWRTLFKMNWNW